MNQDFGVGRRAARINVNKYRPAAELTRQELQPVAVAAGSDQDDWIHSFTDNQDHGQPNGFGGYSDPVNPLHQSGNAGSSVPLDGSSNGSLNGGPEGNQSKFERIKQFIAGLSRKQWIIIAVVVLLLTAGSAALLATMHKDKPVQQPAAVKPKPKPAPPPPTSPLTGMPVSAEDAKRPVIGVMIENSTFARPQSGLDQAGVVYEAIAEYGITRFLALYQEANPGNIGPVRSARPYFVDWAHGYDAGYAHVGGSPDALQKIKSEGVRDLDQFFNSGAYHRISSREAPHNVYTSMQNLRDLTASKGWSSSSFTAFPRKKEAKAAQATAQRVDIAISGPTYNVHYDYDPASNSYLRTLAAAPHKDADSGKQISPKVVIGLATQYSLMSDGYHSMYTVTGSGTAKIFQDGTAIEATWTRDSPTSQYKFADAQGNPVSLNPGQTWITVVGDPAAITYAAAP